MIDTLKINIPLKDKNVREFGLEKFDRLLKENIQEGIKHFEFFSKSMTLGKYSKEIKFDLKDNDFVCEFSIPKYFLGNNIEMIRPTELEDILHAFKKDVEECFGYILSDISEWKLLRVDFCYNWILSSIEKTESAMSFLKNIDFPRKNKYVYNTSVMYKGSSYTVKFYLKGPEFKRNDFKSLKDSNEKAFDLLKWSEKVLRFEVTLRKNYFKEVFETKDVSIQKISDQDLCERCLVKILNKVFTYVPRSDISNENVYEKIVNSFSKKKALKLYQFYLAFYKNNSNIKDLYVTGGVDRSTIYRYKKDIYSLGLNLLTEDGLNEDNDFLLENIKIPSDIAFFRLESYLEKSQ